MSIQEHLNKIRNAVYGREVRQAIHDAIQQAYDDASEKDNANMEVKIARGTHPNLRSRLDETDAQLAQIPNEISTAVAPKADKAYVDNRISNLDGLEFKGAFATLQELQNAHPTGASGLYVVHSNNYWYYWNGNEWMQGNRMETTPWAEFMTVTNEEWVI